MSGQYLLCLDPASGTEHWRLRDDWAWQPSGAYPGPYASPTFSDGRVFFGAERPRGAADRARAISSGRAIWSASSRAKAPASALPARQPSPMAWSSFPWAVRLASLVALGCEDGAVVWHAGDDQASYCRALPITWSGRRLVVGYLRNAVVLHDLKTGELLQRRVVSADYDEHSAWPLYREPELVLAVPSRGGPAAAHR